MKKTAQKQTKKKSNFSIFMNRIMPYILAIFFAIMIFSLMGFVGKMGEGIKYAFYGILSNFGTILFTILLLYHAIMWYYDTKRKICVRRVLCSIIAVTCISTLQHLIQYVQQNELISYNAKALLNSGKQTIGGGVIGGLVGNLLLKLGNILPFVIVLFLFTFMLLQMFNITPASMVRAIANRNKQPEEAPKQKHPKKEKKQKQKYKYVDIFDDDEEDAFDETNVVDLGIVDASYRDEEEEEPTYENAGQVISTGYSIQDSPQITPYDKNEIYTADEKDELSVTTSTIEQEAEQPIPTFELAQDDEEEPEQEQDDTIYQPIVPYTSEDDEDDLDVIEQEDEMTHFEDEEESAQPISYSYSEQDEDVEEDEPYDEETEDDEDYEGEATEINFDEEEEEEEQYVAPTPAPKPEPVIATPTPKPEPPKKRIKYVFPPIDLLRYEPEAKDEEAIRAELQERGDIIVNTLASFGVRTRIVNITRGPTVTRYEIAPEAGVSVKSIANRADDIALYLAAEGIRIECPIPGKSAVGIEVPNATTSIVYLKELIANKKFKEAPGILTCALGKSISGDVRYVDIEKTPHLLVAGATSMGKSVCINSMLISMLYKANPNDVRLILIDPKRVEFSDFNGLPHLLVPVVTEAKKSLGALQWSVAEMERRFEAFEPTGARNLIEYNQKIDNGLAGEKMARIVIVIDELADLKMTVPDIEGYITRLTQKARAAGIHIIIGTQRPSVDVITGLIKSNIPSRISFRVASHVDSKTVLDEAGAEKLVCRGDMLVKIVGTLRPERVQGSLVTATEVQDVIQFIKEHSSENYDESVIQQIDSNAAKLAKMDKKESDDDNGGSGSGEDFDDKFYAALKLAVDQGKISSSMLMRKLGLGFQRASRIIDQMEECGYISEANGSKPRDVLITKEEYLELMMRREDTEE